MGKNGGARPGAGRKPTAVGFRQWCRDVVMRPEVLQALEERALTDTEFALKVAEHGFGRPPQALDIKVGGDSDQPIRHEVTMPGGTPLSASVAGLPTSSSAIDGEG